MQNLSFNDIINADFKLLESNPIIKNPLNSFVVADPSVLTPDVSHDGKWHLFCHTFFGVYRYVSDDGLNFKKAGKIVSRAMRPNINRIDGRYYLFYEHTKPVILNALASIGFKWKSEIFVTESDDLVTWTKPVPVIQQTRPYESEERGQAISNPFLTKNDDKYRMYS